jgi:hypothetical protein
MMPLGAMAPRNPEQAEIWTETFVVNVSVEEIEAADPELPPECEPNCIA